MNEDNPRSCSTCSLRNICALRGQLYNSNEIKITPFGWPKDAHMSSVMRKAGMVELARTCGRYELDKVSPPLMKLPSSTEVAAEGQRILESL
jgi:hypothetical protein